jgi:Fur family ferric uptake transcriptional regulator
VHPSLGTLYELAGKGHHHHFHCRACNRTLALAVPGCALKEDAMVPDGFVVEEHQVFLFGICPSCAGWQ